MKIGIFGGSFNPIHNGHLKIIEFMIKKLSLDKLILVPVGIPSHKDILPVSGENRLVMCKLAINTLPKNIRDKIIISDIEIKEKSISYTIDTLEKIIDIYGLNNEYFEIIGKDSADYFQKWKDYKKILSLSRVVVFDRNTSQDEKQESLIYLDTPLIDISSTMIRNMIKTGHSIEYLIPKDVARYMEENNLYK